MIDKKEEPLCFSKRESSYHPDQQQDSIHVTATNTFTFTARENVDQD